jgi:hypothetical protein
MMVLSPAAILKVEGVFKFVGWYARDGGRLDRLVEAPLLLNFPRYAALAS